VTAINERGLVIGERGSRIPQPFLRAFVWHHGRMTDVAPAGSGYSVAVGINNAGQIIGWSCPCPGQRNFLWQNGVLTDLGGLNPVAINGLGQIVGDGDLWVNGVTTDLGDGMAIAINDAGQVVLRDNVAPGDTVVWENGVATHLGALQGFVPYAINAKGQILGQADNASGQLRAFLWDSGVLRDLGSLDGGESTPRAINDSGQVIGQSSFASTARHNQLRAFLWHDGVMRNLGTLGTDSTATALNNLGHVVGWSQTNRGRRAFIWENGHMSDLGTLPKCRSTAAAGINDHDQIVDTCQTTGQTHALMWTARRAG
jgi:probable HAF family extracellular repeat protein